MRKGLSALAIVVISILLLGILVNANGNGNTSVNKKTVACGSVDVNITAGCSNYITYKIKYYGTEQAECYFYYKISPCEEMFQVIYPSSFILMPGDNTFRVLVSPNFYLKPKAYNFFGYFFLDREMLPTTNATTPLPIINETVIPNEPIVIPPPPIPNDQLPNEIPEIIPPDVEIGTPHTSTNWLFIGLLFACIILVAISLLFLNKKEERII